MITPTSEDEFRTQAAGGIPAMEQVAEGVWTLPLRNKPGHMPFTLSYLIEDAAGGIHIVDPGWGLDANVEAVDTALARIARPGAPLTSITATHHHPDHLGLADRLRSIHQAPVYLHRKEQQAQEMLTERASDERFVRADLRAWGVPDDRFEEVLGYATGTPRVVVPADVLVDEGDLLPVPGRRLRVLHAPGHTPGHICLLDEGNDLLFTGDHVLPGIVPGIGSAGSLPGNPLKDYLTSLVRMTGFDALQALPGHEYRFRGIAERAAVIAGRHLRRTVEVERVLEGDPGSTAWETASQLTWSRGWDALTRHYLLAALRQTALHADLVRAGAQAELFEAWGRPSVDPRPRER